jgi:hypothetical protein
MTQTLNYTGVDINGLHDELIAAGIVPTYVGGVVDAKTGDQIPGAVEIHVDDAVSKAAVDAVEAAHDPAACAAKRQAAVQSVLTDAANIKAFMAAPNANITHLQLVAIVKAIVRVTARRFTELRD